MFDASIIKQTGDIIAPVINHSQPVYLPILVDLVGATLWAKKQ